MSSYLKVNVCWNMTRISFDISPELHQRFKLYCAERKTTITDEVTKFINKTLEGAQAEGKPQSELKTEKEPQKTHREGFGLLGEGYLVDADGKRVANSQKTVIIDGKEVIDDLDQPYVEPSINKEDLEAELKPIRDSVSIVQANLNKEVDWTEKLKNEQFEKIEHSEKKHSLINLGLAKTLSFLLYFLKRDGVAHLCDDDIEFLALLAGEPKDKWTKGEQFMDLLKLLNPQLSIWR